MRLCEHFSSVSAPLRDFSSKSWTDLRVEEVTFRDHKAHSRALIPNLRLPKPPQDLKGAHNGIMWHTMESSSSLGPLSIKCTKRGKESLNFCIKGHQEMNKGRTHFYAGQNFLINPVVHDPEQRQRGFSCWPPNNSNPSEQREREREFTPRQL